MTSPFRPNLGLGGGPFPSLGWVPGFLSCHSGLQGQRAPGTGLGGAGATTTSSVPDLGEGLSFWEAGHSFLATSVSLPPPPFFFFFFPHPYPKECGEKVEVGPERSLLCPE